MLNCNNIVCHHFMVDCCCNYHELKCFFSVLPTFHCDFMHCLFVFARDRIGPFWQSIRDHIYNIVVNNTSTNAFLVERAVVGLMRLAIRLLRRDDLAPQVRGRMARIARFSLSKEFRILTCSLAKQSNWYLPYWT